MSKGCWLRAMLMSVMMLAMVLSSPVNAAQQSKRQGAVKTISEEKALGLSIELTNIKQVKSSESGGDEIYFSVTEYSSVERPRHYLVPNFPTHWLSAHLEELKDVVLWQKPLRAQESVMLVISLLERDAPPWNVDDLIGTVKLKITNEEGQLKQEWTIPNQKDTQVIDTDEHIFALIGDQSEYHVDLKLKQ